MCAHVSPEMMFKPFVSDVKRKSHVGRQKKSVGEDFWKRGRGGGEGQRLGEKEKRGEAGKTT